MGFNLDGIGRGLVMNEGDVDVKATRNLTPRARRKSVSDLHVLQNSCSHWRLKSRTRVRKMMFSPLNSMQEAYICRLSWLPERQASSESIGYI